MSRTERGARIVKSITLAPALSARPTASRTLSSEQSLAATGLPRRLNQPTASPTVMSRQKSVANSRRWPLLALSGAALQGSCEVLPADLSEGLLGANFRDTVQEIGRASMQSSLPAGHLDRGLAYLLLLEGLCIFGEQFWMFLQENV